MTKHAKPIIFGLIHAKWCGACKDTMPIWDDVVKMLKSTEIKCVEIEEKEMEKRLPTINSEYVGENETPVAADGYPTIFRIEGGKVKYYNGDRTADKLFNFATKRSKMGGEGDGVIPPTIYGSKNVATASGGKSRKHRRPRKLRRTKRAKSSWLSFW